MNKIQKGFLMSALLMALFALLRMSQAASPAEMARPPRWEQLGMKKVNYRVDYDEIRITASEGGFTAVKLRVLQAPINMRRMVIHFGNGETQEVILKNNFPRGGESRVIDLKGGKRIIKKVVFWYDSKNLARNRATIQLWGRE